MFIVSSKVHLLAIFKSGSRSIYIMMTTVVRADGCDGTPTKCATLRHTWSDEGLDCHLSISPKEEEDFENRHKTISKMCELTTKCLKTRIAASWRHRLLQVNQENSTQVAFQVVQIAAPQVQASPLVGHATIIILREIRGGR